MNIDLTLVEKKEEDGSIYVIATAVVTPDLPQPTPKGQTRKASPPPTVRFTVNGKAKGVFPIDANGHTSIELKKLEAGKTYTFIAEVLGAPAPTSATEDITIPAPAPKIKKPTGPFGWTMMTIFWFTVWFFGPGWLVLFYLGLTMGALALIAKFWSKTFGSVVGNNNWVFPATLAMLVMSGLAAHWNPMVPEGTLGWFGSLFSSLFGGDSGNSVEESALWAFLNRLFFGEIFTNGWSDSAWVFGLALIPATFVSYTDEVVEEIHSLVKKHGKGESWLEFLKKDIPATIVIDSLIAPLKAVIRGIFKFSILIFMASTLTACSSPSEKEFKRLSAEKPATTTESAEKAYDRVDKLATNVARLKKAPEGLAEKIDVLRKTRAEQFAKLAVKEKSVGSTVKVLAVLVKNGINPATILPTPTPGVTNNNPLTGSGAEAITRKLSRPPVDPTADTIPLEWRK